MVGGLEAETAVVVAMAAEVEAGLDGRNIAKWEQC